MESSAKTGLNVDKIFTTIAESIPEENEHNPINEIVNVSNREEQARYTQYNCC